MDEQTKMEIWDLAAGTFIAVSVVSGMAYIMPARFISLGDSFSLARLAGCWRRSRHAVLRR
jgi:hypothetical protein